MLALDPPEPGATLGGIVSANASGPRRLRYGTVRDLLIGVTVVLADGTTREVRRQGRQERRRLRPRQALHRRARQPRRGRLDDLAAAPAAARRPARSSCRCATPRRPGRFAALVARSTLTPTAVELALGRPAAGETRRALREHRASVRRSRGRRSSCSAAARDACRRCRRGSAPRRRRRRRSCCGSPTNPSRCRRCWARCPRAPRHRARRARASPTPPCRADADLAALRAAIAPHDGSAVVLAAPGDVARRTGPLGAGRRHVRADDAGSRTGSTRSGACRPAGCSGGCDDSTDADRRRAEERDTPGLRPSGRRARARVRRRGRRRSTSAQGGPIAAAPRRPPSGWACRAADRRPAPRSTSTTRRTPR